MSTQLEEQGQAEQAEDEAESEPANALFDRSQYDREDLQIQKIDGEPIDRTAFKFTGTVFLDRSDPADVALYNSLALGRDITLMIEGRCSSVSAKGVTDREGDLDVVVGEWTVKIHTVYRPAGENTAQ